MNSFSIYSSLPIILFITMLPHLWTISITISFASLFFLGWFFLHSLGIVRLPHKYLTFLLLLLSIFILVLNYGFTFSQKASISLLCLMLSLKCMEVKNELDRRNIFLILFLSYFVLVTHFLYSQDIFLLIFNLINSLFITLLLISFNRKPQGILSFLTNISLLSKLFLKAVPIAIILFLFFPRIPGPLWTLPDDSSTGTTGLSDEMYPGSVSGLSNSEKIAFRVDFKTSPPAADKIYWRGPVLSQTDGFLWSQRKSAKKIPIAKLNQFVSHSKQPVSYTITLEPHQKKWLFTLEMPSQIDGDTIKGFYFNQDLQLLNQSNINQLTQYHVTSMTEFELSSIHDKEVKESTLFPPTHNPRTLALGKQWRQSINNDQKIITMALDNYRLNDFYYTRQPGTMVDNPSDQFLFDKKRGFCEHYASSFVLLMRAADIPARVVTGYQGIEKNEVGNYYVVRQSNAHAWAEVWLEDKGWIRVDPTAAIPADHIEADIFATNLDRLNFSSLNIPNLPKLTAQQKTAVFNFWKQINQSIDNLKHQWNNWILGYDQSKQNLLLNLMGLQAHWQNLISLLISSMLILLIVFYAMALYKQHHEIDPVHRFYLKFISKLNKQGMSIKLCDAPYQIKKQAMIQFPQSATAIKMIIEQYIMIRYAGHTDKQQLKSFISNIKQLKLI